MDENTSFSGTIPFNYDNCLGPMLFEPFAIIMSQRIKALAPDSILEVACGTGRLTKFLPKILREGASVIATDLNPAMIDYARHKHLMLRDVAFFEADAQALPFDDGLVECIVSQFGVMFFEDKIRAFKEAYRVLSPNGTLLFCVWDKLSANPASETVQEVMQQFFPENTPLFMHLPFSYFDDEAIRSDLEQAGFEKIKISTVPAEGFAIEAAAAAQGMVYGTPLFNHLSDRAPALMPAIARKLEQTYTERYGERFATPLQAVFVEATKA